MCSSNKSKPEEILKYLGTIVVVVHMSKMLKNSGMKI